MIKNPRSIVQRAMVTEKGTKRRESANQYFFEVAPDPDQTQIKEAVQRIFNVTVEQVRTMWMPPKAKRMGRYSGHTTAWKRAIVTLAADQTIELFEEI